MNQRLQGRFQGIDERLLALLRCAGQAPPPPITSKYTQPQQADPLFSLLTKSQRHAHSSLNSTGCIYCICTESRTQHANPTAPTLGTP